MNLKDKVFIVTGASSGIGEELCMQLSSSGSLVVCAARRLNELERVCSLINDSGGRSVPIKTDITVLKECKEMVSIALDTFGRIDGLILNAGISMWARFEDITDIAFFKNLMDVNYMGAVNCVHAALPHLKSSEGKIISCSTGQALMGFPRHSGYYPECLGNPIKACPVEQLIILPSADFRCGRAACTRTCCPTTSEICRG